ncbi:MAG TPA: MATE family efflux transporter [Chloroflexota bacterium]|nr:MATE family efflux transporter [Chloroflexota bacterium]
MVSPRTRRMLEAPILPTLLRLALPNVLVVTLMAFSSTADALFVSRLGSDALAGVSLVLPVWMLMTTMSNGGFGGGVSSAVARALGGGRRADANALVSHALWMSLGLAALFTAIPLLAGPAIYGAMGGADDVLTLAVTYSNVVFASAILVWLVATLGSVLRGTGEMLFTAIVIVSGEILHLIIAPLLIFGLGPFPALGVAGAGLSLMISYAVRAAVLAGYILAGRAAVTLRVGVPHLEGRLAWEILRVALPGSINTILTNANVMVVTSLVGAFGTLALAGYGAGARLEYLQIPLVFGMGTALVTMVGMNVGAGQYARARQVALTGAGLAAALTGSIGLLSAIVPALWVGFFSAEPGVRAVGETYSRIVGLTYGFFGVGLALYFASQGSGRVGWALLAGFARLLISAGGGWIAVHWFGGGLTSVFIAVALGFVVFGLGQLLAMRWTLPVPCSRGSSCA